MLHLTTTRVPVLAGALATCALLFAGAPAAAQPAYDGIVVFGTSLSDSGNAFALRGGTNTPPDYLVDPLLVPSAPYARGGHHFSNGATWVEQFARSLGLAGSVRPAFRSASRTATNYAVGAARARDDGRNVNLTDQVDAYLADSGGVAAPGALYAIEMGGNDVRDALVAYRAGGHTAILSEAVAAIAHNIMRLRAAGATEFLVWTAPNPALTPAIRTLDQLTPGTAQLATGLTQAFNAALAHVLAQLAADGTNRISVLDAYRLLNDLSAQPTLFGLTDVTSACLMPGTAPFTCSDPDAFLFWDGIHPTRAVHGIIAQRVLTVLGH